LGVYNTFDWGDGTLYGDVSKVAYSASPLTAVAIGSTTYQENVVVGMSGGNPVLALKGVVRPRVDLTWNTPTGNIYGFRLVRNQDGFSENEEDGHIVLETFDPVVPEEPVFTDEMYKIPLSENMYAYYTIWLLVANADSTYSWVIGAYTYCLIPKELSIKTPEGELYKTSERKFIETLPKVYTTEMQSYLDEISETSDLRIFMGGFGYTLDEILTFADLLIPDYSGKSTNPNMVDLQAQQLGLPKEPTLSIQRKKALIRNAFAINKYRGGIESVGLLAKSLSGYSTLTTASPNLLLNIQDSSFYKGTGHWEITGGTLTSNLTTGATDLPVQTETFSVDRSYTGKAITSVSDSIMSLGSSNPRLKGIPVQEGVEYEFSYYIKDGSNNATPYINWYDKLGVLIGSAIAGTAVNYAGSWGQTTLTATSPSGAYFASLEIKLSTAGTYYVDMVQFAQTSDARYVDYYEARGVEIHLNPTKVNYVKNPSMNNSTSWTLSGATAVYTNNSTVPGIRLDGTKMTTLTTTASTNFSLATTTDSIIGSGKYYTFSVYAKVNSGTQVADFKLEALDSSGVTLVSNEGVPATRTLTSQTINTTWQRFVVSVFVPFALDTISLKATILGTGNASVINLDAAQIEEGYGASDYFDGGYTSRGAYWTGTASNSVSVIYRNKSPKINRIMFEVPNYLPINTAFVVTSGFNGTVVLENSGMSS